MTDDRADNRAGRLDAVMNERRKKLNMRWRDVADEAGLSEETIRLVRKGGRDAVIRTTDTEARIERALRWRRGSIRTIREGGEATPLPGTVGTGDASAPVGLVWASRSSRKGRRYPDFVKDDPAYEAIWDISDEILPAVERRYVITQIELLRWAKHASLAGAGGMGDELSNGGGGYERVTHDP